MWHTVEAKGGVVMIPYRPKRPLDSKSLDELIEVWARAAGSPMSPQAFCDAFDLVACADWGRMQPDGSDYGGAWGATEECPERRDAFEATRLANRLALSRLPYPPATVLYAIGYLCPRRCESVARVSDLLAWARAEALAARGVELPLNPEGSPAQ